MDNKFLLYPLRASSPTITPESIRVTTDFVEKTTGQTHSLTQLSPSIDWSDKSLPFDRYSPPTQLLPAHRGPAISHEIIQSPLRLFRARKITGFQHLAFVPYHLIDIDRIVFAVVGAVVIDTTDIPVLVW